jgi:hypothetical protein
MSSWTGINKRDDRFSFVNASERERDETHLSHLSRSIIFT